MGSYKIKSNGGNDQRRFALSFSLLRSVNGALQCQSVYNNVKYADRVKTFAR